MIGLKITDAYGLSLAPIQSTSASLIRLVLSFFFFQLSLLFCRLFPIFLIDGEIYKTIPIQFPCCFTRFYEKNSTLPHLNFLLNVCEATRKAMTL